MSALCLMRCPNLMTKTLQDQVNASVTIVTFRYMIDRACTVCFQVNRYQIGLNENFTIAHTILIIKKFNAVNCKKIDNTVMCNIKLKGFPCKNRQKLWKCFYFLVNSFHFLTEVFVVVGLLSVPPRGIINLIADNNYTFAQAIFVMLLFKASFHH